MPVRGLFAAVVACSGALAPAQQTRTSSVPATPQSRACVGGEIGHTALSGTVLDGNHRPLPDAGLLLERNGTAGACDQTTDNQGKFTFNDLPQGSYQLTVSLSGAQTRLSEQVVLRGEERRVLPDLILQFRTIQQITVTMTEVELAQQQIQAEEKQRALGIFPAFYSSYVWNAAPLNSRQKFDLALHSIGDPVTFLVAGVAAGTLQATDTYHDYGQGAQGYAKYYGATYADGAIARVLGSALFPSLLRTDPRYFYKGSGSKRSRAIYAISRAIIARSDSGKDVPAFAYIGGSFAAGAIANAYHPANDRGVGLTLRNGAIDIAGHAFDNLIREFVLRRLTRNLPPPATGQPSSH